MIDQNKSTQVIELAGGGGGTSESFANISKMKIIDFDDVITTPTPTNVTDGFTVTTTATKAEYLAMNSISGNYTGFAVNRLFFAAILYNDNTLADNTDAISFNQTIMNIRGGVLLDTGGSDVLHPIICQCMILNETQDVTTLTTIQDLIDLKTNSKLDKYSDRMVADDYSRNGRNGYEELDRTDATDGIKFSAKSIIFSGFGDSTMFDFTGFGYVLFFGYNGTGTDVTPDIEMRMHVNQSSLAAKSRCGYFQRTFEV